MNRERALRYCRDIHDRLKAINGSLETHRHSEQRAIFLKVWVFGSTAKGSENPRDLDILYHLYLQGERLSVEDGAYPDLRKSRTRYFTGPLETRDAARKWLRNNKPMVSLHDTYHESAYFLEKVEIWPYYCIGDPRSWNQLEVNMRNKVLANAQSIAESSVCLSK